MIIHWLHQDDTRIWIPVFKYRHAVIIPFSDDNTIQMVDFMLADLSRPSGQLHFLFLPIAIHVFDLNVLIPDSPAHAFKGKAAFLRLIGRIFLGLRA
jgi:hypothetical protein